MTNVEKFTINFGPQHPASHGVLRLVLELDGEIIENIEPHIGYLHRGTEKLIEHKTYLQALPYFDRLDYIAPLIQEHGYVLCVEKLYKCEVPIRAQYIRVLFSELTRIMNHLLSISSHALDTGAVTPLLWLYEEREKILCFFERLSGARFHTAYFRFGGVVSDVEDQLLDDILKFLDNLVFIINDVEDLLTENRIWKQRNIGIGVITKEQAIEWGFSGPMLRSTGVAWDLRKSMPYDAYDKLDFLIPVCYNGDCYDRYLVRVAEIRQSISIIKQCINLMPKGDVLSNDRRIAPPPTHLMQNSMEDLISHFKLYSEGFSVPVGEYYSAVESPKGEFGVYIVSDGSNVPYRCRIRSPNFVHIQFIEKIALKHMLSDLSTILGSLDIVMGEIDK